MSRNSRQATQVRPARPDEPMVDATGKGVVTVNDVATFLGQSQSTARRLLYRLQAEGLACKGRGRGTRYDRADFLARYQAMDTRD